MKNNTIGFTTGCLYRTPITFNERIKLYSRLGADAIELSFPTFKDLNQYELTNETKLLLNQFKTVTIHAPWKESRYNNNKETRNAIRKLTHLHNNLQTQGIVLHPDTIDNYEILVSTKLPFLLENMDERKKTATYPEHIQKLKDKYAFGFVLDLQHAYEHDPTMQLAQELIDVMGDRLHHLHVSGHSKKEIHVPTHLADNRQAIEKILQLKLKVPKILEGILLENIPKTIAKELEYVRKFEQ